MDRSSRRPGNGTATQTGEEEELPPKASAMIEAMRDIGYSLESAVADIIDNSITARASNIDVRFGWRNEHPWIAVVDDGFGMSPDVLREAMRPGTRNPLETRSKDDLGRFGLGLKTASFSQCRRLTVLTRQGGVESVARWDLDHVALTDRWTLLRPTGSEVQELPCIDMLGPSGTLVLWESIDRIEFDGRDERGHQQLNEQMEGISRRLWAPAPEGALVQTRWFYERARGQYANAAAWLTPARKREFDLQNPRSQVITKTDLAKVVMTFRGQPHTVCYGSQKNFMQFAEYVGEAWKDEGIDFGDAWFRGAVAGTIIFRTLERHVQKADWYSQGYRAQIVTYAIALLQHHLGKAGQALDFERTWKRQAPSSEIMDALLSVGEHVHRRIVEAASSYGIANVTEWCKRERCWEDRTTSNLRRENALDVFHHEDSWAELRYDVQVFLVEKVPVILLGDVLLLSTIARTTHH